ncbi:unnamed protein product, partial [Mesorhabditis belari]|uniref:ER membrane protein complex subunit 2 n=1 Tax=Mesorhabditis belari TaxID=2138241 RepID=A0AAF3J3C8_9BILA
MGYLETKDWTIVSFEVGRKTLREWREDQSRRSEEVVELWEHVLSRSPSSLGDEVWMIYEQVCIAALDCARYDLAMECIQELDKRFPRSNRVLKLQAMRYEALEQYSNAVSLYDKLLEADSTNNSYRKRKVSILMAQGKRLEAIKELNEYLKVTTQCAVFSSSGAAIAEKIAERYDELTGINPEGPRLADLVRTIGKQMDGLEERLSEVERVLGISELSEVSAADLDVESLRKSLLSKGDSQVFKIKMEDLQKLKSTMTEPNMKPLDEKLNTIQFYEDLIRKHISLLEEWDANIQPVQDSEAIRTSEQHSAALDLNEGFERIAGNVSEGSSRVDDFLRRFQKTHEYIESKS